MIERGDDTYFTQTGTTYGSIQPGWHTSQPGCHQRYLGKPASLCCGYRWEPVSRCFSSGNPVVQLTNGSGLFEVVARADSGSIWLSYSQNQHSYWPDSSTDWSGWVNIGNGGTSFVGDPSMSMIITADNVTRTSWVARDATGNL
jgi:hypothetical protein